ncbi:MAG: CBS domain-containing protein [Deltaproteobacteria bacterium]|nr:CBS domain-containing protein [Deltaproteobacteria bacterium]MCL6120449.1 CBS domain-containing protein [Deltaproteobacteria bacterium]
MENLNEEKEKSCVEVTEEDIREAFEKHKTYIDISLGDFIKIYRDAFALARDKVHGITVDKVMSKNAVSVHENSAIHDAMNLLAEKGLTCAPVVNDENAVVGFLSDSDILTSAGVIKKHTFKDLVRHLIGEPTPHAQRTIDAKNVKDIMTSPAITVSTDTCIKKAASVFNEKRIKVIPVVDINGKLAGVISMTDIIKYIDKN